MPALLKQARGDGTETIERFQRRSADGRYEVSDADLIRAARERRREGDEASASALCEVLLQRCAPEFARHSYGLRHRPDLREEVIANMGEHIVREVMNPGEEFMVQNFIHYLRCACIDEFNEVLRQEGLRFRRDDEGNPIGRPNHIPRSLMDQWPMSAGEPQWESAFDVLDQVDPYELWHAREEVRRILDCLTDPRDRRIVELRVLEGMIWDEIAVSVRMTERNARLRFRRALAAMRQQLDVPSPAVRVASGGTTAATRDADEAFVLQAEGTRLAQALATLSPQEQQVLALRLYQRKRWREIKAIVSMSEGELCKRYGRALGKLRALLTTPPSQSKTA